MSAAATPARSRTSSSRMMVLGFYSGGATLEVTGGGDLRHERSEHPYIASDPNRGLRKLTP